MTPEEARELANVLYWGDSQERVASEALRDLAAQVEALQADAARLDFLDKNAVIAKSGQSVRKAIDAAREQS